MKHESPKTYWKVPPGQPAAADPSAPTVPTSPEETWSVSRRRFLEATGFSIGAASLAGCGQAPQENALPFVEQPEAFVPGRMRQYATFCDGCTANCGLLVGSRDGRPLKMEGMPSHPLSKGGLCAVGQALPLGLYDSNRLAGPLVDGEAVQWDNVDSQIFKKLAAIKNGEAVRVVTPTITSPSLQTQIDEFLAQFDDGRHVVFDASSSSAILDAHKKTHAARVLPHYRLDKASVIVSFGADFLGTWISPVEFTAAWQSRRAPSPEHPQMSYHVQFESRMSLTGSNADRRIRISPKQQFAALSHVAFKLSQLAEKPLGTAPATLDTVDDADFADVATRLWAAKGTAIVLSDSQDVASQVVVNYINDLLDGYGNTLDVERHSHQKQGNDADVIRLLAELESGKVAALFVAGTDLTQNLPRREKLAAAIAEVPLVVSLADRVDDFASLAGIICPDHHALESWTDTEPVSGLVAIGQPTSPPIKDKDTRAAIESFARWSHRAGSAEEIIREHWKTHIFPRQKSTTRFAQFWNQVVHDGYVEVDPKSATVGPFDSSIVKLASGPASGEQLSLLLYNKIGLPDSRHSHNPWLQELPDPITKVTWDNYACVSSQYGKTQGLVNGDMVRVEADGIAIELPVFVQPGQDDSTVAIALAYGCRGTDRFAKVGPQWFESNLTVQEGGTIGENGAAFIIIDDSSIQPVRQGVTLKKTGKHRELASTQEYDSIQVPAAVAPRGGERRDIVQETTLSEYKLDPKAGTPVLHHGPTAHADEHNEQPSHDEEAPTDDSSHAPDDSHESEKPAHDGNSQHGNSQHGDSQLWADDHPKVGHAWAMVIDLNKCTGCSSCLIACQSENNVPVVGRDEVRRQREMHWLRIDRYYSGKRDKADEYLGDVDVYHQPMMCQHCDNAPCETVCPVLATVHSEEGLNVQAYNRCVGTRYCANNCPYKVRRFNWFDYPRDDTLQNLALNPDVTVRSRGVMEKCSMCVQRIEDGKIEARRQGEPLADGAIQTACQQSCPAQATVFGDMNDPKSGVSSGLKDTRRYKVLEEFNFRPAIGYLRVVKNSNEESDRG